MDMEQLKYVLAVAKQQHFSKAADDICISQSSLSKLIGKLEDELGVKLFDRTTRTVRLTPAGREFLNHAVKILAEIDNMQSAMQEYSVVERGQIVLGAIPIMVYRGLSAFIASFQRQYPGIQLKIREAESKRLLQMRRALEIDVAFVTYTDYYELNQMFELYPVISDEIVLVCKQFHPLAERDVISLAETEKEKYVFMTQNFSFYDICFDACRNAGFKPIIVHESSYHDTIIDFVSAGFGVALLSSHVAGLFAKRFAIKLIRLEQKITITVALAIPRDLHLVPGVRAFKKFALDWFKINK